MNYLAHAYLSFGEPGLLIGNMISDYVKGKRQYDYPEPIQKGIRLHRQIDAFTDQHPATKTIKTLLKPAAGPYAGAFADVVYDHFLARDTQLFPENSLNAFAQQVYGVLVAQQSLMPEKFARLVPYMVSQNWLNNYQFTWGIEKSFEGVGRRARYPANPEETFILFNEHYESLETCYHQFFPDVKTLATAFLHDHIKP